MSKTILIVDDNAMNRALLGNMLSGEYEIFEAYDGKDALDIIRKSHQMLSAVLLDILMPVMDGYETLSQIRDSVEFSDIPVIMVTGSEDEQSRSKALALGANDFIVRPYNPDVVCHCVKNNIAQHETAIKLNAIQKDKLTGLYSREAFFETVSETINSHKPNDYILACFDIDNFKLINDQFGTLEGDQILREIGKTLSDVVANLNGIGGRISGDDFAVLIPNTNDDFSIVSILKEKKLSIFDKHAVVFSEGCYLVSDLKLSANSIYDRAYIAKQSVKGRYDIHIAYFDDSMLQKLINNQQIIAGIGKAVSERQFEVWYQPQRNHVTGALVGAEALVRWRHPSKGLIPPVEFVPVFEQNGFIFELDKYVWEETCAQLRRWLDNGRNPVPVSVNISRQDLLRVGFIETLKDLIKKYDLPIELLRLEITESAFAKSTKLIVDIVQQLIDIGFIVEIDDFGSGYSSLNTLKSVPAQVVKLDMRFLEDDNDGERGGNILESIVRMTKWLGMSVIVEGVEEKAQADFLTSIGCSNIQGYYYSKPLPVDEYEAYCSNLNKDKCLVSINAVDNLDNNSFWDPKSMDTLIFNSFVGGACIFEYFKENVELLRANQKFVDIFGNGMLSIEDTLKLDWISYMTPESRALVHKVLKHSYETKEEYTNEYVFNDIPGVSGKTYLRITMRVIAITGGRCLVYSTCENITAQREAEIRERRASEQIKSLMDDMPGGFVRMKIAPDGSCTPFYFNDGFSKLTGMDREELRNLFLENILNVIHPEDHVLVKEAIALMLETGKAQSTRYRIRHKTDSYIWVSTFGRITKGRTGETVLNAYFVDATNQVKEEELQKALMDNLPCGAGIYEIRGDQIDLKYHNKVYCDLIGQNEETYTDGSALSDIHPDDIKVLIKEISDAIYEQRDAVCDLRLKHSTKGYRYVNFMGRIVFNENSVYHVYATFAPVDYCIISQQ